MTRIKDRWGLPRRWTCWRDWLFWLYACFDIYLAIQLGAIVFNGNVFQLELWAVLLITILLLITYGAKWWVLYDSYVWDMPERVSHCLITFWCWPVGIGMYLQKRPEWLAEIVSRQDKLY